MACDFQHHGNTAFDPPQKIESRGQTRQTFEAFLSGIQRHKSPKSRSLFLSPFLPKADQRTTSTEEVADLLYHL